MVSVVRTTAAPHYNTFGEISAFGMWRNGVWQMGTNVSDETADSILVINQLNAQILVL